MITANGSGELNRQELSHKVAEKLQIRTYRDICFYAVDLTNHTAQHN